MENRIIIFHGSERIIEKPEYGKGRINKDFGRGFYCTEDIELAKEWACDENHGGYANKYELNLDNLKVLDLCGNQYSIIHWISVLLCNRRFTVDFDLAKQARNHIIINFPVVTSAYDIIKGYRADGAYGLLISDFLHGRISVRRLIQMMNRENQTPQIVLISEKAFSQIWFIEAEEASKDIYFANRMKRDETIMADYLYSGTMNTYSDKDKFMVDFI